MGKMSEAVFTLIMGAIGLLVAIVVIKFLLNAGPMWILIAGVIALLYFTRDDRKD